MRKAESKSLLAVAHIHKTAGTTLSGLLKRAFGRRYALVYTENPSDPYFSAEQLARLERRFYPRLRAIMGHGVKPWGDLDEHGRPIDWVTFVRDPIVRCASHYQYDVQRGGIDTPFEDWITHPGIGNRQTEIIAGPGATAAEAIATLDRFAHVGLQERFDRSLVLLRERVGIPSIAYASKWQAPENDIKKRLLGDPKAVELLVEANREDALLYQHVVHEIFPKQEAEYGPGLDAAEAWAIRANRTTTSLRMRMAPKYLAYLARWRLRYQPWVEKRRSSHT